MQYPICIEWGDENTAIGIQIPDIPGAATAGDSFEDAYNAAVEIAHILLQEIAAEGEPIPMPTSAAVHRGNPEFADMGWGMLELDISPQLVQNIKLAEVATGLGTENVRAPRLPLQGAERERVLAIIDVAMKNRPVLPAYKNI